MLLLKYALLATGGVLFLTGMIAALLDAHQTWRLAQTIAPTDPWPPAGAFRWALALRIAIVASVALLPALGAQFVAPLIQHVEVSSALDGRQ